MRSLRPYQVEALNAIKDTINNGVRKIVLALPVGAGKTLLAANIASGVLRKGNKMAFVVPRIDLCDQTMLEFYKEGIHDVSIIQANNPMEDWGKPIQICSINTLERRNIFPDVQVVLFDEIHLIRKGHQRFIEAFPNAIFIGLSATPWTPGLGDHFDTLIVAATMKDLMEQGYLSKYRAFAPNIPNLKGIKKIGGDYHEGQLSERLRNDSKLTGDIVESWKKLHGTDRTLVFAVDRKHAKVLQARFEQAGIKTGYQDALTPKPERAELKRKFHSGGIQVLVSVETLIIGVDYDVRCISLCRSTESPSMFVQLFGRGTRLAAPGSDPKPYLTFLDHSGTITKLGFPEEIGLDELLKGKEKKLPKLALDFAKPCSKCAFMKPPRTPICPNCGFKAEVVCNIVENDGDLEELVRGRMPMSKKGRPKEYTMAEKGQFLAELKAYALQKGYKEGYAAMKYKDRFSVWPDWSIKDIPAAPYPTVATLQFIKHSNIKWAKSQAKQQQKNAANL